MSALSPRRRRQPQVRQDRAGDTVLLSSRVIPGNEKSIYRVIDHLERRDANVIHDDGTHGLIHVSGHGSQEELRLMINLRPPQILHPHPRRLPPSQAPRRTRRQAWTSSKKSSCSKTAKSSTSTRPPPPRPARVTVGRVCIDAGGSIDVVEDIVIRDRQHISEGGIVLPIITINKRTGKVERQPEIVMRGFAVDDPGLMISESRAGRQRTLESSSDEEKADYGVIKEKIRNDLKRYIQKSTSRRPLIMPVILEI
jgi:ribonuclease J